MKIVVVVCVCDECKHQWLAEDPERCPRCRSRRWDDQGRPEAMEETKEFDPDADAEGRFRLCKHKRNEWTCENVACKILTNR